MIYKIVIEAHKTSRSDTWTLYVKEEEIVHFGVRRGKEELKHTITLKGGEDELPRNLISIESV